jgi:beta-glucosidase
MNIVRNPLCGRNYEYYSEDPLLSGLMAASVTRGVQAQPGNYVTLKHFCANNQESNRQHVSSSVDERVLREIYWKGFEIAVKESAPRAVMAAYNKLNGIYCTNNRELCTGLLRGEWRFDGIVMTDWMATGKGKADEAAAIRAGVDLLMPGGKDDLKALTRAARDTSLPEEDIRRAAARVLQLIV